MKTARSRNIFCVVTLAASLVGEPTPASARLSMAPQALTHYSLCVNQAKDRNLVFTLERGTKYRCEDDIAVAYYNYLGRRHIGRPPTRENRSAEPAGVFIYRSIPGIGKCWNMIEAPDGQPVSFYGCDIYVEL